jgi:hypothetical protein
VYDHFEACSLSKMQNDHFGGKTAALSYFPLVSKYVQVHLQRHHILPFPFPSSNMNTFKASA